MKQHAASSNAQTPMPRRSAMRTALVLASIALVLFGGVIYAQYSGEASTGIAVTGFAIIGFVLLAVTRRSGRRDRR